MGGKLDIKQKGHNHRITVNYSIYIIAEYTTQLPLVCTEKQLQIHEVHLQSLQLCIWHRERERVNDTRLVIKRASIDNTTLNLILWWGGHQERKETYIHVPFGCQSTTHQSAKIKGKMGSKKKEGWLLGEGEGAYLFTIVAKSDKTSDSLASGTFLA